MTREEMWIAKRIGKGTGFQKSFVKSMKREMRKKEPSITELQADWLWELAFRNRHDLLGVGALNIVQIADSRHIAFDFRLRVRGVRREAQAGKKNQHIGDVELKVESPQNVYRDLADAASSTGKALSQVTESLARFGVAIAGTQQALPLEEIRIDIADGGGGALCRPPRS